MRHDNRAIPIDPWVASSLLQKAIRRDEVDYAVYAARTLHRQRGSGIWRRFLIIACEDVGIADLDLVRHVAMLGDRSLRQPFGPDEEIVADVAQRLAEAPKDRSSDYLACAAIEHPGYEHEREAVAVLPVEDQIAIAVDSQQPIVRRAIACWYSSGVNGGGCRVPGSDDLRGLLRGFERVGFAESLSGIIETAARKTREPMTIMLPLVWALLGEDTRSPLTEERPLPTAPCCGTIPAWALDKHTRAGKRAFAQLIRENPAIDAVLSEHVADFRALDVLAMACFYVDAIPVARRLMWTRSHELESLGLETDMAKVGCPRQGIEPILEAVVANLNHLNAIRCRLFGAELAGGRSA